MGGEDFKDEKVVLEFQPTGNKSLFALPWGAGGHLPPASSAEH